MNVNGVGGSPYLQGMQGMNRNVAVAGGLNAREIADTSMARKMLPMQAAGIAATAATEAKGLFVDTYA